jgi:hypothetical protein
MRMSMYDMSLYKVSDVGGQKFAEIISNYFSFHN